MRAAAGLLLVLMGGAAAGQEFAINATIEGIPNVFYAAPALGQGSPSSPCSETGGVGLIAGSAQWTTSNLDCDFRELYRLGRDDPATRQMAIDAYRQAFRRAMFRASIDQEAPLGIVDSQRPAP